MTQKVLICDTQPVTGEGLRALLNASDDLEFLQSSDSLPAAMEIIRRERPEIVLMDKTFGVQQILDTLAEVRLRYPESSVIIWGIALTEAEALRFLQAGARGILRKTAPLTLVLACLRTVGLGRNWMEDSVFRESMRQDRYPRSELTPREQQVLELVEQGFKNKDIARELGIRPGTVKIHLKHIFEKTGVRGRYGLALNGLKDRGLMPLTAA
jgi:DNA-binding NarL/FixJ family response regulator